MKDGLCASCRAILAPGSLGQCHKCSKAIRVQVSVPATRPVRPPKPRVRRDLMVCPCGGISWATPGHLKEGQYWCHACLPVLKEEPAPPERMATVQRLRTYCRAHMPEPRKLDTGEWANGQPRPSIDAC